jgi:hypothetical protein
VTEMMGKGSSKLRWRYRKHMVPNLQGRDKRAWLGQE